MHCVVDCGGDVANEAAHGGAQPVPKKHRVAASTCPDQRGPGSAIVQDWCYGSAAAYGVTVLCVQDSDCADGTNGRCLLEGKPCDTNCSYDTCFSDSDCPDNQPCECRDSASSFVPNFCVTGSNCRVDADCGPNGFCSPSVIGSITCGYDPAVIASGYFCHKEQDSCVDDSDCDSSSICAYSPQSNHWTCVPISVCY